MKMRTTIHWLAGLAGGLLLAVPALGWAASDWGPGGVPGALDTCQDELQSCRLQLEDCPVFPGDGWPEDGYPSGGAPLAYYSFDYFFVDLNTRLWWAKLQGTFDDPVYCTPLQFPMPQCAFVLDVNNMYTWTDPENGTLSDFDGTVLFVLTMHNETCGGQTFVTCTERTEAEDCAEAPFPYCGLGGHTDWRLPTAKELHSLVDYSRRTPEDPDAPTVSVGLPGETAPSVYWSSTSYAVNDTGAFDVSFANANVFANSKTRAFHVRAVRGGW